ncbi:PD-(D/E)XK motif protein [Pseudonocardia sp. RS11V-5]|uniref:PD-(D/E)XK motif protein n=1 Tax=Pseudonocardia terrae TaxID=2905831 RepID=UPI001E51C043|nr:PD-(D/E)XK motif protein [Pseudonocardia terrae]MCE3551331.1 PD-(D/E)XK motif protein [Pseudonocardia terrae]
MQRYLQAGLSGDVLIPGRPEAYLIVAAVTRTLSIHVGMGSGGSRVVPDLSTYQHLDADTVYWRGSHWFRLSVRTTHRLEDLYPLLCLVLDAIQLNGRSFAAAVNDALDSYRELLVQRGALSEADQIGLVGELLTLKHLITSLGPDAAVDAWVGGKREEHDFSLSSDDLEVKTTAADRRTHWISSATQLEPKPGRDLYLLSLQITRAGAGPGSTLPELVDSVRVLSGPAEPHVARQLVAGSYRDTDADLYPTRWTLRSPPITLLVDAGFPALTSERLVQAVPRAALITSVSYQLDLETYPASTPPRELVGLVAPKENAG